MPMTERDAARKLHDHRGDQEEWEDTPARAKVQPARTEVVSFRLPSEQLDVIEGLAEQAGQSISEFIRSAVLAYISGETMEPFLDVQSGASGELRLTMRTSIRGSGYTSNDLVPDHPFLTVSCLD
jgi:Arc/MetJ-type ribon-helix-helix transcriptional regulator